MIVADSSSLILLAKASVLEQLADTKEIVIAEGVYMESVLKAKDKGEADTMLIEKLLADGKMQMRKADRKKMQELEDYLGLKAGENETVALAEVEKAAFVIIDDRKGINACKVLKIPFMISLDVVVDLCYNKRITTEKAMEAIEKIRKYGWVHEDIIKSMEEKLKRR